MYLTYTTFVMLVCISLTSTELKKVSLQEGHNPGICDQNNHGTLIMIKDRENNDKLLVCAQENEIYLWKATDGSNPAGEFYNPAYDCSDILNKNSKAKDGFYWIKLSGSATIKVWCDMTTDGGGFMLIGHTNSSSMWEVPSNSTPVGPFGQPQWSSSLGDAPIVDFRVQVATEEDFSKTRSHWSLRLLNQRPLKNLLMVNEGGCGRLSPGIGDVAYVKDLLTQEIVSTTFRCSHFGTYHIKSSRFGWDMMNFCLERPCPFGFAYYYLFRIQTDHSGAFSYSASANSSGISQDSTSFVGCENRKCCACFGPLGGQENYCGTECKAKNGGTIVKSVYTWFWVRSSLPKRHWNKCMEYKAAMPDGNVVWNKLSNGNPVATMDRCNRNEALLNDGIVVVPDGVAAQKVPPVPGLLKYRKDNMKLYVRSNETWNVIGEEKKVLDKVDKKMKPKLDQMGSQHNTDIAELKKILDQLKSHLGRVSKSVSNIKEAIDPLVKSCASLYQSGERKDGVYKINPDGLGYFQVRCDMTTDGGGWTVFQRRRDGSVDFYRGWQDYKNGFGDLNGEFWLGLDKIHRLTQSGQDVLRVDLMTFDNTKASAKFASFSVAGESESYRLNVGSYSGTAGNSLNGHNGRMFSTKDRDNDPTSGPNCAVTCKGAWWYFGCHISNLNGLYLKAGQSSSQGINWYYWKNSYMSMKRAEMKIRPAQF